MVEKGLTRRDLEELFSGFGNLQDDKFKGLEDRVDGKLKGLEERVVNQFHIIAEGLTDPIKLLAEGHAGIVRRLDVIDGHLDGMEKENERQHLETRALIKLSYAELDRRLSDLESQMKEIQEWKKRVEARLQA